MGVLDFKGRAAANAWKAKAEDLNQRADTVMKGVTEVIEHINTESRGQMVDELVTTGSQMVESAGKMVSAFAQLVTAVDTIIDILSNAAQAAVDFVTGNRGKMIR